MLQTELTNNPTQSDTQISPYNKIYMKKEIDTERGKRNEVGDYKNSFSLNQKGGFGCTQAHKIYMLIFEKTKTNYTA